MKHSLILFIIFFVLTTSCNKKVSLPSANGTDSTTTGTQTHKPDYSLLPTKGAKWYMHYQGAYDQLKGKYDTSYHFYSTYSATGKDTIISNEQYYIHKLTIHTRHNENNTDDTVDGHVYASFDTINNKVHYIKTVSNVSYYKMTTIFSAADLVKKEPCFGPWAVQKSSLVYGDSIVIDGHKTEAVYMTYKGAEYFYFAKGLGGVGVFELCPYYNIAGYGGTLRSFAFKYKSDSLHFDYPYVH